MDASIRPRPGVLAEVDRIRQAGIRVAALTNNWTPFGSDPLTRHFDVVVESVVEGTRKPERRIYEICLERLALTSERCVMFDDLGPNLKTAKQLGITTVKVTAPEDVIAAVRQHFP
ncbi:MAG: HAD-IA family hydrolase [Acidimicrobiia bacterium]